MIVSLTDRKVAILRNIEIGCFAAVLAGGEIWQEFKRNAETSMNMKWPEIKDLMDRRYHAGRRSV